MPAPNTLEDALKVIDDLTEKNTELRIEIAALKIRSENSVGGFLTRNQSVIVALIMAVTAALVGSGVSLYQNQNTRTELQQTQEKQAANKEAQVATEKRVESLDSKIVPPLVYGKPPQAPDKWLPAKE